MIRLLFVLALGLLAAAAWQSAQAWDIWRQRRLAAARALGLVQGKIERSGSSGTGQGLRDLLDAGARGLERLLPAPQVLAWDRRLQRFPALGRRSGHLALQCLSLAAIACGLLACLDGGLWSAFGLGLGAMPVLRLMDAEKERRQALRLGLPDAVDLLTACVQAGLGLDLALHKTGEQLPPGPLREEWLATLDQLRTGADRRQAFGDWERRCGIDDLGPVLRAILRSEQRGVPLSPVLQAASEQMRRLRSLRVQEQAAKAPIKLLLPLMLFFLPAVFLILFGPVFLKLSESGF